MIRKLLTTAIVLPILAMSVTKPAFAFSVTQFGSCLNPQVSPSQVNAGSSHGVVGYSGQSFSGTDSIYSLSNGNVMQCLCADNGNGYQTTWLPASGYSASDISVLQSEGWSYFVDAGLWGLNGAYLAKTATYSCSQATPTPSCTTTPTPSVTGTPTPTPTGTITPTPTPGPTNTPTPGPTATPTPGPASQSVTASLASTGNSVFLYGVLLTGGLSLLIGLLLKKFSK